MKAHKGDDWTGPETQTGSLRATRGGWEDSAKSCQWGVRLCIERDSTSGPGRIAVLDLTAEEAKSLAVKLRRLARGYGP